MLGFYACGGLVFEGCVEADAVMGEKVVDRVGPVAPVLHAYFALIRPVMFCFAVWVSFSPCVCVYRQSLYTLALVMLESVMTWRCFLHQFIWLWSLLCLGEWVLSALMMEMLFSLCIVGVHCPGWMIGLWELGKM